MRIRRSLAEEILNHVVRKSHYKYGTVVLLAGYLIGQSFLQILVVYLCLNDKAASRMRRHVEPCYSVFVRVVNSRGSERVGQAYRPQRK